MRSVVKHSHVSEDDNVRAGHHISPEGHGCMTCLKLLDREGICEGQSLNFHVPDEAWDEYDRQLNAYNSACARGLIVPAPRAPRHGREEATEQSRAWVEFYGECHGRSEIVRIEMGSTAWRVSDACSRFAKMGMFDPTKQSMVGLTGKTDISREYEEPARKPLVTVAK